MALPKTWSREVSGGILLYWLGETFYGLHFAPLSSIEARTPIYDALTSAVMIIIPALLLGKAAQVAYDRHSYRANRIEARSRGIEDDDLMVPEDK